LTEPALHGHARHGRHRHHALVAVRTYPERHAGEVPVTEAQRAGLLGGQIAPFDEAAEGVVAQ